MNDATLGEIWTLVTLDDGEVSVYVYLTELECWENAVEQARDLLYYEDEEEFDALVLNKAYAEAIQYWYDCSCEWDFDAEILVDRHKIQGPPDSLSWWHIWMRDD